VRRMHHFGVELHGVEFARVVGDEGVRGVFGFANDAEAVGKPRDAVAVAHPHLFMRAVVPHARRDRRGGDDVDIGAAKFAVVAGFDEAAQLLDHRLLAVADAEQRDAHGEQAVGGAGGVGGGDAGGAARKDDPARGEGLDAGFVALVEGPDFAVDAQFPQAAGDELGDLGPEIHDQDAVLAGAGKGYGGVLGGCVCHGGNLPEQGGGVNDGRGGE